VTGARPGWYPDPGGDQGRFRWWDGSGWTSAVSDSAHAAPPARSRSLRNAAASRRSLAAWSLGLALVAVAGVVLGRVFWHDPTGSSRSAAAGVTAKPSPSGVPGELDQSSREARIGDASMRLPGDPYQLRADPMRVKNLFDSYFAAGAIVHEDYHQGQDWSAVVGLAHVAPTATRDEVDATAATVGQQIAATFFDHSPTTIERASVAEHSVDGCSGYVFTAVVSYLIPGLASRADELTVIVVRLDDGTRVAAFSSVPTDAPQTVRTQAAAALESLHVG
jgi:hypothetical protein